MARAATYSFEKNGIIVYFRSQDAIKAAKVRVALSGHKLGSFKSQANQPDGLRATCERCGEEVWVQWGRMGEYWEILGGNAQMPCEPVS